MKISINNFLLASIYFAVLISFVGNGTIFSVPVFFLLWILIIFFSLIVNSTVVNRTDIFTFSLSIILCVLFAWISLSLNIEYNELYPLWAIKVPLLFLAIILLELKNAKIKTGYHLLVTVLFLLSLIKFGYYVDGRLSFVFGPNMLYRLVTILSIYLIFLAFRGNDKLVTLTSIFVFVFSFYILMEINSRGSFPGYIYLLLILMLRYFSKTRAAFISAFLVLSISLFLGSELNSLRTISLEDLSLNIRSVFLHDFLNDVIFDVGFFGESYDVFIPYSTYGFQYPHNLIIELILFYGVPGLFLSFLMIFSFFQASGYLLNKKYSDDYVVITAIAYITIFLGAQFSGDLSDNFGAIGLALYGLNRWKLR